VKVKNAQSAFLTFTFVDVETIQAKPMTENNSLFIKGVPRITYGSERDSFIMALRAVGQVLGRDLSYPMLKGFSASAFRLIFHPDWQRYSPDALCGFDHSGLALAVLGLCAAPLEISTQDPQAVARSRAAILASLKSGWPVLALHLMGYEDWGVIAGYREGGTRLLCRTPHDRSEELSENEHWPWLIYPISAVGPGLNPVAAIRNSLQVAVRLFETEKFEIYFSGKAAYAAWIAGLRDTGFYIRQGEPQETGYEAWARQLRQADRANAEADRRYASPYLERVHVNHWRLTSLIDARRAAAGYLLEIAPWFDGPAAAGLAEATQLYNEMVGRLEEIHPLAPAEWCLEEDSWTPEKRARQAEGLERALDLEERAIVCIREALRG
jgi:hypothetical protein